MKKTLMSGLLSLTLLAALPFWGKAQETTPTIVLNPAPSAGAVPNGQKITATVENEVEGASTVFYMYASMNEAKADSNAFKYLERMTYDDIVITTEKPVLTIGYADFSGDEVQWLIKPAYYEYTVSNNEEPVVEKVTLTFNPADGAEVDEGATITITASKDTGTLVYVFAPTVIEAQGALKNKNFKYYDATRKAEVPWLGDVYATLGAALYDSVEKVFVSDFFTASYNVTSSFVVPTPTFDPDTDTIPVGSYVKLVCSDPKALIAYTIGAGDPDALDLDGRPHYPTDSATFPGLQIKNTTTVYARAYALREGDNGFTPSALVTKRYVVKGELVATPTFDPAAGEVEKGTKVSIACATEGATIHYNLNGGDAMEYSAPIEINENTTITAFAQVGNDMSKVARAAYTVKETPVVLDTVQTPTFSPVAGEVEKGAKVSIACTTDGADIYYTTNGATPDTNSTKYTEEIAINETVTIKAVAVKAGMVNSRVATAAYTVKTVSVEDNTLAKVRVYPNPSKGDFHVVLPVTAGVDVFTADGKHVKHLQLNAGTHKLQLNASGIYFVRVTTDNNTFNIQRVVVE